jgi:hypothetical protein
LPHIEKEYREKILARVKQLVASSERLSRATSAINIKGNQVYLNQRCLPLDPDTKSTKALIEGQLVEKMFARITLLERGGERAKLEWPGPGKQWTVLYEGSLEGCVDFLSKENYFDEGTNIGVTPTS